MMKYRYLSYFMNAETPLYGGEKGIDVQPLGQISKGDTANTKSIKLHNHSGTHIDFPNHFIAKGKSSSDYDASFWHFQSPFLYERTATPSELINLTQEDLKTISSQTDFLIIKTGFGQYRVQQKYWKFNPGLSPESADVLREQLPNLRVVGMDFISLTSFQNRPLGRVAHHAFLGGDRPLLLVEDMNLSSLETHPKKMICTPLMIEKLDGCPVTIIAEI